MKKGFALISLVAIAVLLLAGCASVGSSFAPTGSTPIQEQTSPELASNPGETSQDSTQGNTQGVGEPTQPSDSVPSTGTLTVLVTDAPSYTVTSVVVSFSEVWVHRAGAEQQQEQEQEQEADGEQTEEATDEEDTEEGGGEWIKLAITGGLLGTGSFDLAELRDEGATAELAAAELLAGKYTQLKVVMDETKGVQVDYEENPSEEPVSAKLPSGTLRFVRPFTVEADGSTQIVLDFDLQKSVVFKGSFGKEPNPNKTPNPNKPDQPDVIVKPVVKLQVTSSGSEDSDTRKEAKLDGKLTLENKNPDSWAVIKDDIRGMLRYSTEGEKFSYDFKGFGLEDIEYSLIYYADTEDRFNVWGGNNPGALIVSGTAVDGELMLSGSIDLGMSLPHPDDANGYFYDYTQPPDSYDHATGAKIWLVPSADYDTAQKKVINWNPTAFLFETDLITYERTDDTAPVVPANLVATAGNGQVSLNWDDNTDVDLKEYNVYRGAVSGGPYTKIATATESQYTNTGLTNGTAYYYVVAAVDNSGNESEKSVEVSATPAA